MKKKYLIYGLIECIIIIFAVVAFLFYKTHYFYDVVFSDNGTIIERVKVKKNEKVKIPKSVTKEGYEIDKYLIGDKEYDFNSKVTKSIVIEVTYKKKEEKKPEPKPNPTPEKVKEYTITFDTDGGSTIESIKVKENEKIENITNPTRDGYDFVEWQVDGVKFDFETAITKDLTLKAVWNQKQQAQPQPTPQPQPQPTPQPVVKNYTVGISQVDAYSPDVYVTIYENGNPIAVNGIAYSDGYPISASSNGTSFTVAKADIEGERSLKVTLKDGSVVIASM